MNHKDTLSTIFFSNVMLYVIVFLVPVIITIIFNVVNISIVSNISRGIKDQNRKQGGTFLICSESVYTWQRVSREVTLDDLFKIYFAPKFSRNN